MIFSFLGALESKVTPVAEYFLLQSFINEFTPHQLFIIFTLNFQCLNINAGATLCSNNNLQRVHKIISFSKV